MKLVKLIALIAVILVSSSFAFAQASNEDAIIISTKQHFDSGNFSSAIDELNQYVKKNKKDALAFNLLARAYTGAGGIENRRKAVKHFKKSLKLDKSNLEFRNYYGELMLDMGDRWNAEKAFKYIIKKDVSHVKAYSNLMKLYILKRDTKKVLEFEATIADLKTKGLGKEKMTVLNKMEEELKSFKNTL